jgi:hypothetical protein
VLELCPTFVDDIEAALDAASKLTDLHTKHHDDARGAREVSLNLRTEWRRGRDSNSRYWL